MIRVPVKIMIIIKNKVILQISKKYKLLTHF